MSLGRRLTFRTVLEFELVLTILELSAAPCEGELLPCLCYGYCTGGLKGLFRGRL